MWPAFLAATAADALIGHAWPPAGDSQALFAAGLLGLVFNLIAVILLSHPIALLLRRRRPDLPMVVARDYAGTGVVVAVAALLAAVGLFITPPWSATATRWRMPSPARRPTSATGLRPSTGATCAT